MQTTRTKNALSGGIVRPVSLVIIAIVGIIFAPSTSTRTASAQTSTAPTTINVSEVSAMTDVRRLGTNIGTQDYWDSGQMLRQIMFRNPGFEGKHWQSILHCQSVTATSCTDDDHYTGWPVDFLKGAKVEFILGKAIGTYATVTSSTVADQTAKVGVTVNLSGVSIPPSVGDYLVARFDVAGNADSGWWESLSSGASLSTEFQDLSPNSPGKQALRVTVPTGEQASITSYTDGYAGRSFLQMNGTYTFTFRAKSVGGAANMNAAVTRNVTSPPAVIYFDQNIPLTTSWKDYSYTFSANDMGGRYGTIQMQFIMRGASVLLDDVALTASAASDNPTPYRDEVVSTLRKLKPGTLRYMDSGLNWGSTIDNMLVPDFARVRAGYSNFATDSDQIPMGLNDFLELCAAVGAEPWYTMQTGMSLQEMSDLMDYLGGTTSTPYGARRSAMGHTAPWTSVFKTIHLEFGNEVWNTANPGASMVDPVGYGQRAGLIFTKAKSSPAYSAKSFDLVLDGFEAVPSWNELALQNSSNYDTVDVATYVFASFNDTSSIENIFGPMFAEPEMLVDTPGGLMNQHAIVAASAKVPAKLAVYESSVSPGMGSASQSAVDSATPSVGAGITSMLNFLMAQRDLGVNNQNLFSLTGYHFKFSGTTANAATTTPIWASVIDMGGQSNLQRPSFLAEALANSAILPTLLQTSQTGNNPTWNQPHSTNNDVTLANAHYLQSFAYTDGNTLNVIAFNLSRTKALPITFAGLNAPLGAATINTLTSGSITDSNEASEEVAVKSTTQTLQAGQSITLPPFSMTVISTAAPVIPIKITSISLSCARSSLSPNGSTSCTDTVVGQGKYNSGVTWSVDQGTVTSAGVYTAPSTVPASGKATVTVTSVQDTTIKASFPITIAADTVTGVQVSCDAKSLGQGLTTNCSANVSGTGSFSGAYTWSLSGGSITPAGLLTASLTGSSMTVTATSAQDPSKSGSTTIALTPVLTISNPVITPTATGLTASWTVNSASHSGVGYGIAGGSTTGTPYDGSLVTNPSYTLSGLAPGATYTLWLTSYTNTQSTTTIVSTTLPTASKASTPPVAVTGVSVSCGSNSVVQGGSTSCTPTVAGTGAYAKTVTWSVSAGSVTTAGVVTAPATGTSITVTAKSTQDPTKSGSFTIALTAPVSVTGVFVSCASNSVVQGGSTSCTPTVAGTGAYAKTVTWSVSAGSVTTAGVVTAPATGTTITVTAKSTQDPTKSGSFTIALTAPVSVTGVSVSCASNSVVQGGSTSCTPTVAGTGAYAKTVTWSVSAGSVTPAGVVTAPATGTTITVTAKSTQDPTKSGSFTIALTAPVSITGVSVSCGSNSVVQGGSTSCTPTVAGTGAYAKTVTWSVSAGSVTTAGVVTAPATGTSITVTAKSTQDTTKSGSFTIALTAPVSITGVSVSCGSNSVAQGGSTSCTPTVAGTGAYAKTVTWSVSAGSVTTAGVVTAPSTGTTITVTAKSTQDTTKSGSFTIVLTTGTLTISNPVLKTTSTSITASWVDSLPARNGVGYGIVGGSTTGTPYDNNFITAPTYTLTGLTPGSTYNLLLTAYTPTQTAQKLLIVTLPPSVPPTGSVTKVSIICANGDSSLVIGGTTTCSASTSGTGTISQAVTFSTSAGSISSGGVLTAPSTGSSVQIRATSVQDPTKSGTFTLALQPKLTITDPVIATTSTSITASWTTNVQTRNGVGYGIVGGSTTGTPYDNNFTTSPSYTLTGLTPGATYTLWLSSYNNSQNFTQIMTVSIPK